MSEISEWLGSLNLEQYAEAFEANEIDLDLARDLDEAALEQLGVRVLGHRL
ncbi:MAG: SAM domain-containing protein, partial [Myxococcota bacterium]